MILIDVCILAVRSRSLYTVKDTPWLSHFAWNFLLEDLTLSFSLCNGSVLLRNYHLILQFFFFSRQDFIGVPDAAEGSENRQHVPLLVRLLQGGSLSLYGVGSGCAQGPGWRGGLGDLSTLWWW